MWVLFSICGQCTDALHFFRCIWLCRPVWMVNQSLPLVGSLCIVERGVVREAEYVKSVKVLHR